MIEVRNIQIVRNQPFEEYLEIDRISCSKAKSNGRTFKPSAKTRLGSAVDNYLGETHRMAVDADITVVKPLAAALMQEVGGLYYKLEKQATLLADFIYDGYVMHYKGRPDWFIRHKILIDTKVAEDIHNTFEYFNYAAQVSGYGMVLGVETALVIAVSNKYNPPRITNIKVPVTHDWWADKVLIYGTQIKRFYV